MKVLFVCSGNICRSPMAAEWFRLRAAAAGLGHVAVDSAGTLGIEERPASDDAVRVLREAGCDLAAHRSHGVRSSDVASSDLVVVMELRHREILEHAFPGARDKVVLLRAFEHGPDPRDGAPDLDDPIGRSLDDYRTSFACIRACVEGLVLHLRHRP